MNAVSRPASVPVLSPSTYAELERFATIAAKSEFVPREYRGRPADVMLAVQLGSELGLAPLQSLQNVAVINGKPSIYGDALLAVCLASPVCERVDEEVEGEGDAMLATCIAQRKNKKPVVGRFSVDDAKRANLWGKGGPWTQYPRRMLQMRARGFALRDAFPDVLRGLIAREEAEDYPGRTLEAVAEPAASHAPTAAPSVDIGGNGDGLPVAGELTREPDGEEQERRQMAALKWCQQAIRRFEAALNDADLAQLDARHVARYEALKAYPTVLAAYDRARIDAWERVAPDAPDVVERIAEAGADRLSAG